MSTLTYQAYHDRANKLNLQAVNLETKVSELRYRVVLAFGIAKHAAVNGWGDGNQLTAKAADARFEAWKTAQIDGGAMVKGYASKLKTAKNFVAKALATDGAYGNLATKLAAMASVDEAVAFVANALAHDGIDTVHGITQAFSKKKPAKEADANDADGSDGGNGEDTAPIVETEGGAIEVSPVEYVTQAFDEVREHLSEDDVATILAHITAPTVSNEGKADEPQKQAA